MNKADPSHVSRLASEPKFRKATENMLLTYSVLNELFGFDQNFLAKYAGEVGIVLASSHGELEVSKDFLKGLASQNVARPILFQNSLHNSTLGFLTLQFGLKGPGMTLSNQYFSGEDALDTAMTLLNQGECRFCAVLSVDTLVKELEPVRDHIYPQGVLRKSGCAGMLLASEAGLKELDSASALASLGKIDYYRSRRVLNPLEIKSKIPAGFYDADAIEHLILALESGFDTSPLNLVKPDGSESATHFRRL